MPIARRDTPPTLRPFQSLGVSVDDRGRTEALGDCPFCMKEGHFSIEVETGKWHCLAGGCGKGSNIPGFLTMFWRECVDRTTDEQLEELAANRSLLSIDTLKTWGVCRSFLEDVWIVPALNREGKVSNLSRYVTLRTGEQMLYHLPKHEDTPQKLFGLHLCDDAREEVHLFEAIWDAMAWWETIRKTKNVDGQYSLTANEKKSVGGGINVVAAPGCNTFDERWSSHFAGKNVYLMYDSDHPKLRCVSCKKTWSRIEYESCPRCSGDLIGPEVPPGAYEGIKRVVRTLAESPDAPKSVNWLAWGEEGYEPTLPSGFDVRDHLKQAESASGRSRLVKEIMERLEECPASWSEGVTRKTKDKSPISCLECTDFSTLEEAWLEAMHWTDGLRGGLLCMLATITSVRLQGDQLWLRLISPPSSGKTVLCEAVSTNRKWVYPKDQIRGLHSGYKTEKEGTEDHGLMDKIKDKTLVTKDGDTLLKLPNLPQVMSQFRAAFDTKSRSHYHNGMSRDYENQRFTWILCGTESLCDMDQSELGERLLTYRIMEDIDMDLERSICRSVLNRLRSSTNTEANGKIETSQDPATIKAMRLTGGYVDYLRTNSKKLVAAVKMSDEVLDEITDMGILVSFMRSRPVAKREESATRELGARLCSQLGRLAFCLGAVLGKNKVDREIMDWVRKVALDTARGTTLKIASFLFDIGGEGASDRQLSIWTAQSEHRTRELLHFLSRIKAVEKIKPTGPGVTARGMRPRWRLTKELTSLYESVALGAS
jgi:hypothetical protein